MAGRCTLASMAALALLAPAPAIASMVSWYGVRGVQIRSLILLEGGVLTEGNFSNGQWENKLPVQHPNGLYKQLNLSMSFNIANQTSDDILIPGGVVNSDPNAPNYIGGGMLHNDYQWYTFGGQAETTPNGISVNQGNVFSAVPSQSTLSGVSPENNHNPIDVSDNITVGAYASSQDPEKPFGWYFSGMVSETRSQLLYVSSDGSDNHPSIASNTFTRVDMSDRSHATFTSLNFPDWMAPRGEAGLVWLPFGSEGVLIAMGGTVQPRDLFTRRPDGMANNTFMTDLLVYDIAADTWYNQSTRENGEKPPQLARFCTAVVPTQDGNSQEIYVYGGYDGLNELTDPIYDDVWVLSVPAFQWTRVGLAAADSTHGRAGHVCFAPNPTSMISVGGTTRNAGPLNSDTGIDVLNLNTLEWTGSFDASSTEQYLTPQAIVTQLGWSSQDGPGEGRANGLSVSALDDLFSTAYAGTVRPYEPYSNATNEDNDNGDGGSSSNSWKIPVIATLCTVIPLLLIGLAIFFCLRRRRRSVDRTKESRKSVRSWLGKADPQTEKSETSDGTLVDQQGEYAHKRNSGAVYEVPSNTASPGWGQNGNAMMAAGYPRNTQPQEIYTPPAQGEMRNSQSFRNHPYYPRSLSGDYINSPPATSRFSENINEPTQRYELPQNTSNEKLGATVGSASASAPSPQLSSADPTSATTDGRGQNVPRTTLAQRPGHNRDPQSLSSISPSLPSPGLDEENRRSRALETLPDSPSQLSKSRTNEK